MPPSPKIDKAGRRTVCVPPILNAGNGVVRLTSANEQFGAFLIGIFGPA